MSLGWISLLGVHLFDGSTWLSNRFLRVNADSSRHSSPAASTVPAAFTKGWSPCSSHSLCVKPQASNPLCLDLGNLTALPSSCDCNLPHSLQCSKPPSSICLRVTSTVMKHRDQTQVGEERVYLTYTSTFSSIVEESSTGTQTRQEPGSRN